MLDTKNIKKICVLHCNNLHYYKEELSSKLIKPDSKPKSYMESSVADGISAEHTDPEVATTSIQFQQKHSKH